MEKNAIGNAGGGGGVRNTLGVAVAGSIEMHRGVLPLGGSQQTDRSKQGRGIATTGVYAAGIEDRDDIARLRTGRHRREILGDEPVRNACHRLLIMSPN